jgi:hypothetical protein
MGERGEGRERGREREEEEGGQHKKWGHRSL